MISNARFLEEAKYMEERWKKSGLLEGVDLIALKRWNRVQTAALLESQRLMNEIVPEEQPTFSAVVQWNADFIRSVEQK